MLICQNRIVLESALYLITFSKFWFYKGLLLDPQAPYMRVLFSNLQLLVKKWKINAIKHSIHICFKDQDYTQESINHHHLQFQSLVVNRYSWGKLAEVPPHKRLMNLRLVEMLNYRSNLSIPVPPLRR